MNKNEKLAERVLEIIDNYDWDFKRREDVLKTVLNCINNFETSESVEDFIYKETLSNILARCDDFEKQTEEDTIESFEIKCMDIIELIVRADRNYTRNDAIKLTERLFEEIRRKKIYPKSESILERVIKEYNIASDDEYNALRAQLFD